MRSILFILLGFLLSSFVFGATPKAVFQKAEVLYKANNFDQVFYLTITYFEIAIVCFEKNSDNYFRYLAMAHQCAVAIQKDRKSVV